MINLTPAQARVVDQVRDWIRTGTDQSFSLAGYAGTGKTTLIRWLVEAANEKVHCCTPTGKAAAVLESKMPKGTKVSTIHSFLYQPLEIREQDVEIARKVADELKVQAGSDTRFRAEYVAALHRLKKLEKMFDEKQCDFIDRADPNFAPFVIVDEASMVNAGMEADLRRCAGKILFVGDPGQLPPVEGTEFFGRNQPNAMLEEIHRQAADSTILRLATSIRLGERFTGWDDQCTLVHGLDAAELAEADQVITGKNVTRRRLNVTHRRWVGYEGTYPQVSERIMCLRNDNGRGLVNGIGGIASTSAELDSFGDLRVNVAYEGRSFKNLVIDPFPFMLYDDPQLSRRQFQSDGNQFDFGYAITVHKAQGSEWPHVVVWDDKMRRNDEEHRRRWTYTAATRAGERLTWVNAGGK